RSTKSKGLYHEPDGNLSLIESGREPEDETSQIDHGYAAGSDRWVTEDEAEESTRTDNVIKRLEEDWYIGMWTSSVFRQQILGLFADAPSVVCEAYDPTY
ncbi:hypothetical protein LTR56_027389, partial [Elasticomyces elasticus]